MRVLAPAIAGLSLLAGTARADDVTFTRGGPNGAGRAQAVAALTQLRAELTPCWKRGPMVVEVALTTDATGAVTSSVARTDGPAGQCVAGLLAVATIGRGAWSGTVQIAPPAPGTDDVGAALRVHGEALRACQAADPKAAGTAEITLRVHADGTISDVAVATALSPKVDACLIGTIGRLRLDTYRGKEVRYRLGLQFGGGGASGASRGDGGATVAPPEPAPTRRGALGTDEMLPVIEASRAGLTKCITGAKKKGTLVVRFTIRKDGTVKNLAVKDPVGDAMVEQCVLDRFKGMHFPSASDETQVQFPLVVQ
jgi:TonB family protein